MSTFFRISWALAGLVLSAPAFLPPLAVAAAVAGLVIASGMQPARFVARLWSSPEGRAMLELCAVYLMYWLCVGLIVTQFVRKKSLSIVPLSVVAVVMVSVLIATTPWRNSAVPFAMGPLSLLHVGFMLTIVWHSFRTTASVRGAHAAIVPER